MGVAIYMCEVFVPPSLSVYIYVWEERNTLCYLPDCTWVRLQPHMSHKQQPVTELCCL